MQYLKHQLKGELFTDEVHRVMYAVDASVYCELPLAVAYPKNKNDIKLLIDYARENNLTLIPRGAGTSLAGQVVGKGIVVDVSRYLNRIIEINTTAEPPYAIVEPGVIRDQLNKQLQDQHLFFAPETSTSNRCTLGGMAGNNSCGANSLLYGSTRNHVLEMEVLLADGSSIQLTDLDRNAFEEKCALPTLEGNIYRHLKEVLSNETYRQQIREAFPDPEVKRRSMGLALDELLDTAPFTDTEQPFNLSKLIVGSEGTLAFITKLKLRLTPLPPQERTLLCIHCNTVEEALQGNLLVLQHNVAAIELMDKTLLDLAKENPEQARNRFFIKDDPGALLIAEIRKNNEEDTLNVIKAITTQLSQQGIGFYFSVVKPEHADRVWALRKAGLGVLSNMKGDAKPVAVCEDTAIAPTKLPEFINEFQAMLTRLRLSCVYYGHVSTGELHLRPVLNLKSKADVELFHTVGERTAALVKKYRGSLSGEHGDGRLRGEFLPFMFGKSVFSLLQNLNYVWDKGDTFNANKTACNPPKMNTNLRYIAGESHRKFDTAFDFFSSTDILRAIERCNGSADCRRAKDMGGNMCPTFKATQDEHMSTRGRANILRWYLTRSTHKNPFSHHEIKEVLDTCLSCKACKIECPSNVDMTKFKAEFLQQYYKAHHHIPFHTRMVAYMTSIYAAASKLPRLYNAIVDNYVLSAAIKIMMGFSLHRSLPTLYHTTLRTWAKKHLPANAPENARKVYFFVDEFTNTIDARIGITALQLLTRLGYYPIIVKHAPSGRTFLSKGLLQKAQRIARKNIDVFKDLVSPDTPLIGIEPSGILTFRDEYIDLCTDDQKDAARTLAKSTFLIDEFIANEYAAGRISPDQFTADEKQILFHSHCYQKALSTPAATLTMLRIPVNYHVEEIKSGCCGMAGAFGFARKHFKLSQQIARLSLFPAIEKAPTSTTITATGTSCRHQILDGLHRTAYHPIEILFAALKPEISDSTK